MTEFEWLAATDPRPMLRSLIQRWRARERRGAAVDWERLRLFACACCRRASGYLDDDHLKAVAMIEAYARSPSPGGLGAARRVRRAAKNRAGVEHDRLTRATPRDRRACLAAWARNVADSAVWQAAEKRATTAAYCHAEAAQAVDADCRSRSGEVSGPDPGFIGYELPPGEELAAQAAVLRDIAGNPFRAAPAVDPAWLAWQGGAVRELARATYEERLPGGALDPARLAVLADALEDAGCGDAELLGHLRRPGPHVRGCHALDLLLGKG